MFKPPTTPLMAALFLTSACKSTVADQPRPPGLVAQPPQGVDVVGEVAEPEEPAATPKPAEPVPDPSTTPDKTPYPRIGKVAKPLPDVRVKPSDIVEVEPVGVEADPQEPLSAPE